HGPGQRVAYVMLDLNRRRRDIRVFVAALEAWIIATLAGFNVRGERREDRVGVWVKRPDKGPGHEDK
ncbi:lipoyl protein ligase domain-containing protein, partial [Escherichia coli]|uniref:lipoyl protein ligase domain-containing protein n=1 Tax=Escherichia coli TaxID=562 RepID=UPI00387E5CB6